MRFWRGTDAEGHRHVSAGIALLAKVCGLLICLSASGCLDLFAVKPSVPPTLTREQRLKIAADASFNFECEKQWDLLWPLAREGDGEALWLLAADLRNQLEFPGSDAYAHYIDKQGANARAMVIYAAVAPRYPSKRGLHLYLGANGDVDTVVVSLRSGTIEYRLIERFPQSSFKRLETCLASANTPAEGDKCVRLASELGLAPTFSEYRKAVDDILSKNRRGRCFRGVL
jgi:hypothetical protein